MNLVLLTWSALVALTSAAKLSDVLVPLVSMGGWMAAANVVKNLYGENLERFPRLKLSLATPSVASMVFGHRTPMVYKYRPAMMVKPTMQPNELDSMLMAAATGYGSRTKSSSGAGTGTSNYGAGAANFGGGDLGQTEYVVADQMQGHGSLAASLGAEFGDTMLVGNLDSALQFQPQLAAGAGAGYGSRLNAGGAGYGGQANAGGVSYSGMSNPGGYGGDLIATNGAGYESIATVGGDYGGAIIGGGDMGVSYAGGQPSLTPAQRDMIRRLVGNTGGRLTNSAGVTYGGPIPVPQGGYGGQANAGGASYGGNVGNSNYRVQRPKVRRPSLPPPSFTPGVGGYSGPNAGGSFGGSAGGSSYGGNAIGGSYGGNVGGNSYGGNTGSAYGGNAGGNSYGSNAGGNVGGNSYSEITSAADFGSYGNKISNGGDSYGNIQASAQIQYAPVIVSGGGRPKPRPSSPGYGNQPKQAVRAPTRRPPPPPPQPSVVVVPQVIPAYQPPSTSYGTANVGGYDDTSSLEQRLTSSQRDLISRLVGTTANRQAAKSLSSSYAGASDLSSGSVYSNGGTSQGQPEYVNVIRNLQVVQQVPVSALAAAGGSSTGGTSYDAIGSSGANYESGSADAGYGSGSSDASYGGSSNGGDYGSSLSGSNYGSGSSSGGNYGSGSSGANYGSNGGNFQSNTINYKASASTPTIKEYNITQLMAIRDALRGGKKMSNSDLMAAASIRRTFMVTPPEDMKVGSSYAMMAAPNVHSRTRRQVQYPQGPIQSGFLPSRRQGFVGGQRRPFPVNRAPAGVRTRGQLGSSLPSSGQPGFVNVVRTVPVVQQVPASALNAPGGISGLQSATPLSGFNGLSPLGGAQPGQVFAARPRVLPQGPAISDADLIRMTRPQALSEILGTSNPLTSSINRLPAIVRETDARIRQAADAVTQNAARATAAEVSAANQAADIQVNTLSDAVADLRDQHRRDLVQKLILQNELVDLAQREERERLADQIDQLMAKHQLVQQLTQQSIQSQLQSKTQAAIVGATQQQATVDQLNRDLNRLRSSSERAPNQLGLISK